MIGAKSTVLAAFLVVSPLAARASELPLVRKPHPVRAHHAHYASAVHIGYYWYRWGERRGSTRTSWCGSTFTFFDWW